MSESPFDRAQIEEQRVGPTIASRHVGSQFWSPPPASIVLVFDGFCGFCTRWVRLLKRCDRHDRVTALAGQLPQTLASTGVSAEQSVEAAWAVCPDGRRTAGAPAVALAVAVATGSRLPIVAWRLPLMPGLLDRVYRVIARNRRRLRGDAPWCEQHRAACRESDATR